MMIRVLLTSLRLAVAGGIVGLALMALSAPSRASTVIACQDANASDWPVSPQHPCPTGSPFSGNGSISATTTSALLNTLTVNSSSAALPLALTAAAVINVGTTDAAICANATGAGATCTCPENGVAATNGITLAAGGGYNFNFGGLSSANPTVVACSGTATLQVQW
jgi:hypothetical protein